MVQSCIAGGHCGIILDDRSVQDVLAVGVQQIPLQRKLPILMGGLLTHVVRRGLRSFGISKPFSDQIIAPHSGFLDF